MQGNRRKRGSLANLRATRYLEPSFSSSAITQSVTHGVALDKLWTRGFRITCKKSGLVGLLVPLRRRCLLALVMGVNLGAEAVHHRLHHFELVLDAEVHKVSVHEHVIWWTKRFVELEKHGGRSLVNLARRLLLLLLLLLLLRLLHIRLEAV